MKKKVLALVLTLAMLASVLTVPAAAAGGKTFPDAKGHWAEESIMRWNRSGLVNGDDLGNVNPNKPLRRCEMATVLSNMLGLRTAAPISTFLDIDGTEWYARAILRCAAAGIMQGSNSMSCPEDYITREEAITMFCRALNVQRDDDPDLSKFSDGNKVSGWAAPYMGTLTELGILSGMGDGTVAPHDYINRAGAFVLMDKAISVYANAPGNYTSQNPNGFVVINSNDYQSGDVTLSGKAVGVLVSVNTTDTVRLRDLSAENVAINGKGSVIISGKSSLDNVEAHTEIELTVEADATVDTLDINGERIVLTNAGTVKNLSCDKVATVTNSGKVENLVADAAVSITNTGTVDKLVANAGIKVDNNKGTIKNAEINMGGVVMDGAPQQMTVASGVARPNNSGGRPISATGAVSSGSGSSGSSGSSSSRPSSTVPATGIKLNKTATTLTEGDSEKLIATLLPSNAKSTTVTWSSDAEGVAAVDQTGKVTAVHEGTATITASISVTVTVPDPSPSPSTEPSESPDPSTDPSESPDPSTDPGESPSPSTDPSESPEPSPSPSEGEGTESEESTDLPPAAPAAVRAGTPVAQAETTTTYTATCVVTVTAKTVEPPDSGRVEVETVTISGKPTSNPKAGEEFTLTATVLPEDATDKVVTWTSSNPAVATVADDGKVTTKKDGTTTITATAGGKSDSFELTVDPDDGDKPDLTPAITVTPPTLSLTLKDGEEVTQKLTATKTNADNAEVTWSSSDTQKATVSSDGTVTAVSAGEVDIIASITVEGTTYSAKCAVTVNSPEIVIVKVSGVTVDPPELMVKQGETLENSKLTATITPETANNQKVTWSSDNEEVAKVDDQGNVTIVGIGKAIITVTTEDGGFTASCTVTVSSANTEEGGGSGEGEEPGGGDPEEGNENQNPGTTSGGGEDENQSTTDGDE